MTLSEERPAISVGKSLNRIARFLTFAILVELHGMIVLVTIYGTLCYLPGRKQWASAQGAAAVTRFMANSAVIVFT
jgi:hypothetical protein